MSTERGRAILGTPHGKSISRLLLHHRDLLGRKTIKSVTYFTSDASSSDYHLLWEVVEDDLTDIPTQDSPTLELSFGPSNTSIAKPPAIQHQNGLPVTPQADQVGS